MAHFRLTTGTPTILAALFLAALLATTAPVAEARLRSNSNGAEGANRKRTPYDEEIETALATSSDVTFIVADEIKATMLVDLQAEDEADTLRIQEEDIINARILEDQARHEQERFEDIAQHAATQEEKDRALAEDNLARKMLVDAKQQEQELMAMEELARTEHAGEVHRRLRDELEIREDGKVVFNGKLYEPDQIQFDDSDNSVYSNHVGAIEEDRPDDEDDVELVRAQEVDSKNKE